MQSGCDSQILLFLQVETCLVLTQAMTAMTSSIDTQPTACYKFTSILRGLLKDIVGNVGPQKRKEG